MAFEDEVKRVLEKHKGNIIDDSLINTIVCEYANTFSCWDVSKYYSEDNNEEMTEKVDDSKRKIQSYEERLVRIMDKNRLTIPKEAFKDLGLTRGDYALVRWYVDKKLIEVIPVDIKPKDNEN